MCLLRGQSGSRFSLVVFSPGETLDTENHVRILCGGRLPFCCGQFDACGLGERTPIFLRQQFN